MTEGGHKGRPYVKLGHHGSADDLHRNCENQEETHKRTTNVQLKRRLGTGVKLLERRTSADPKQDPRRPIRGGRAESCDLAANLGSKGLHIFPHCWLKHLAFHICRRWTCAPNSFIHLDGWNAKRFGG
jgi:hypothetical protein